MGWDQTYNAGPTKPFLIDNMEQGGTYRVLDYAATFTVAWMAVECLTDFPYGKGRVFAAVTLIHRSRDGSLTKKDLSESMGIASGDTARAPLRILDKLSPVEDLYGPARTKTVCDSHFDCRWTETPGMRSFGEPHVNQREEPDGAAVWAAQWRDAVRAYHAKPKPKLGTLIRFAAPVRFTNGEELADFEYMRGSTFRRPGGLGLFRITGWKDLSYEVIR